MNNYNSKRPLFNYYKDETSNQSTSYPHYVNYQGNPVYQDDKNYDSDFSFKETESIRNSTTAKKLFESPTQSEQQFRQTQQRDLPHRRVQSEQQLKPNVSHLNQSQSSQQFQLFDRNDESLNLMIDLVQQYKPIQCQNGEEHSEYTLEKINLQNQANFQVLEPLCTQCIDQCNESLSNVKSLKNILKELTKQILYQFEERRKLTILSDQMNKFQDVGNEFISLGTKLQNIGQHIKNLKQNPQNFEGDLEEIKQKVIKVAQEKNPEKLKLNLQSLSQHTTINKQKGRLDLVESVNTSEIQNALCEQLELQKQIFDIKGVLDKYIHDAYSLTLQKEVIVENVEKLKFKAQIQDDFIKSQLQKNDNLEGKSFFPYKIDENNQDQVKTALRQTLNQQYGYNFVDLKNIERGQHNYQIEQGEIILPDGRKAKLQVDEKRKKMLLQTDSQDMEIDGENIWKGTAYIRDKKNNKIRQKDHYFLSDYYNPIYGDFNYYDRENKMQSKINKSEYLKDIKPMLDTNIEELQKGRFLNETHSFQLEIAFVIDTTSSMDPYIDESKNTILQIIQNIENKYKYSKIKFLYAIVAYRDYLQQVHQYSTAVDSNNYVTKKLDFSDKLGALQFIQQLDAFGGNDVPEAVLEGLYEASGKLSWDLFSNIPSIKFIIHIADAPPHGTRYNEYGQYDMYKAGSITGLEIEHISKLMNERNIYYILIQIGNDLKKMISVFKEHIVNINISSIQNQINMTHEIIDMIAKELE